jgi:RND family efflux transporter MFP subunit
MPAGSVAAALAAAVSQAAGSDPMKKLVLVLVVVAAAAGAAVYLGMFSRQPAQAADGQAATVPAGGRGRGGAGRAGFEGRGGRGGPAGPLTVETAVAAPSSVAEQLLVVGNLIGDATVSVVPRAAGRLETIDVRLGDAVQRGHRIAKIEDYELQEQLKQQEAGLEVSRATIRQREADLRLAETNAERSRSLFVRQLLPKQTLDDTEARLQSAQAQLDLARAQNTQSEARLDELKINLDNTVITSPVNGFVARRTADPGAFVSPNAPLVEVVDIGRVRLVANIVERDLRQVRTGDGARVEVDAYPGEMFMGRIARLSPVLDPATRTAPIEIEIANPGFRLKPGMYARVTITTDERKNALVVPSNAVVDYNGRRGVFVTTDGETVTFAPVRVGIEQSDVIELLDGAEEGDRVVTTGAAALRDGDRVILAGAGAARGDGPGNGAGGRRGRRGGQP